ncbi:hypothetical protein HHI36_001879, partial [Cryptolaemus montrouzieri]
MNKLNYNNSAGPDGVKAKLLKIKEPKLIKDIHAIIMASGLWKKCLLNGGMAPFVQYTRKGGKLE